MEKALDYFQDQIRNIRHGTISTGVIDTVRVECYGQKMHIKQIAWTTPDKQRILVTPYDSQLLGAIDRALKKDGFNSYVFSKTQVVVNLPIPSGEDRLKAVAVVSRVAEEAKVSIRNIRKKHRQKLTKDEIKETDKALQQLTDDFIAEVDRLAADKIEVIG